MRSLRSPAKPKPKFVPLETFPQHRFPQPYAQLLTFGITDTTVPQQKIADTLKPEGESAAHKLVEIALDSTYDNYYQDSLGDDWERETRLMTPLNAVLTLGKMGEFARVGVEPLIPLLETENDELREALPEYYTEIGEAALPALFNALNTIDDTESNQYIREGVADCLCDLGQHYPELRERVIEELVATMLHEKEQSTVAGFIVGYLLDLDAKDWYPRIVQAFEEGRVDEQFIMLGEVQEHFGMEVTARTTRPIDPDTENMRQLLEINSLRSEQERLEGIEANERASAEKEPGTPFVKAIDVGRNEPCPCGSGKKYKKCHGA